MAIDARATGIGKKSAAPALRERVVRELEHDILTGNLAPGERLDERRLAERLGVSRTPVREAIGQLVGIGLIEVRPRSGTFVAKIRIDEVYAYLEALLEIEAACARLAARRMSAGEKARLAELARQCAVAAAASAEQDYVSINAAWHEAVIAGAHNPPLYDAVALIRRRAMPFRNESFYHETRLAHSATEHGQITDAILRGDEVNAERLVRHHLDFHRPGFAELLDQMKLRLAGDAGIDE